MYAYNESKPIDLPDSSVRLIGQSAKNRKSTTLRAVCQQGPRIESKKIAPVFFSKIRIFNANFPESGKVSG
jgi:hypothetical protein